MQRPGPRGTILGAILAGGASSRMGAEKAFVPLAGRPLLAHVAARVVPQVGRALICANGDPGRFADFGLPVVADTLGAGPLAGLHAAMRWARAADCGADAVLTVPVDTPFIPANLALGLAVAGAGIAVAGSASGRHPAVALWSLDLADDLAAFLASGAKPRVSDFAARHAPVVVTFASIATPAGPVDPFFNVNDPSDAAQAQRLAIALADVGGGEAAGLAPPVD